MNGSFPYQGVPLWEFISPPSRQMVAVISGGYRKDLPSESTIGALTDARIPYYCTGGGAPQPLTPYTPSGLADRSVLLQIEREGIYEVDETPSLGAGDIELICFPDGKWQVKTELSTP